MIRPRPNVASAVNQIRYLYASSSRLDVPQRSRRAPLATDLDGISLDQAPVKHGVTFLPNLRDLGQPERHVEQLLSVRLQRRLPDAQRLPQISLPYARARVQRPRPAPRATTPVARLTNPRTPGYRPVPTNTNRPGAVPRTPRTNLPARPRAPVARMDRADIAEPEVPLIPAKIPPRIYNFTFMTALTAPSPLTKRNIQMSDPVQRVREAVGGDYSQWVSKDDLAAAGQDQDVSAIARARLALAFNSTVSPENRKKLINTTRTLLDKGKPPGAAPSA